MIFIRKKLFIILLLSIAVVWSAWWLYNNRTPVLDDQTVAIVNKTALKVADFEKRLNNSKANYQSEYVGAHITKIKNILLKKMIIESLINEEASRRGITVSDKELSRYIKNITYGYSKAELDQLLFNQFKNYNEWSQELKQKLLMEKTMSKVILEKVKIPEEEIKTYYDANYAGKISAPKVTLAQVFTSSKEKAQKALDEINAGADFGEVAKKYSEAPEAKTGGIVGTIAKGEGIEVFDKAFDLPTQTVSGIIQSEYGFHILKTISHMPASEITYDSVKPLIVAELTRQKEATTYNSWLSDKIKKAKIIINKALLDSIK